jgi:lipopolysaccharide export system protein LptC
MPSELPTDDPPDLRELALGTRAAPRPPQPWPVRLRELLASYLPLLLMVLLALATWWLVKHTPLGPDERRAGALRHEPDYTMEQFVLERFDASGRLRLRVEGRQMRHYPDDGRFEVDLVRVLAVGASGRDTHATANRAIGNADASQVQLLGDAVVTATDADGTPIELRSEFLQLDTVTERVTSPLPTRIAHGGLTLESVGIDYRHGDRRLDFGGPAHAAVPPPGNARR